MAMQIMMDRLETLLELSCFGLGVIAAGGLLLFPALWAYSKKINRKVEPLSGSDVGKTLVFMVVLLSIGGFFSDTQIISTRVMVAWGIFFVGGLAIVLFRFTHGINPETKR
jgi:hypothetical protein